MHVYTRLSFVDVSLLTVSVGNEDECKLVMYVLLWFMQTMVPCFFLQQQRYIILSQQPFYKEVL